MKPSHEILREAMEKTGVKSVAASLGLSRALVYKWCETARNGGDFDASGSPNPLDRVRTIFEATGDLDMIRWICQMADGTFVPNPRAAESIERDVLLYTERLIAEFSEALASISRAYGNGRHITGEESACIRKEWEDLKSAGESFVRACETGLFERKSGGPQPAGPRQEAS